MFQVVHKIKATRVALLKWQKVVFQGKREEINDIRSKLGFIPAQPLSEVSLAERSHLMKRLDALLGQEETYWRQRSQSFLLWQGDMNTRFFHQRAKNSKANNFIIRLIDKNGSWQSDDRGIETSVLSYFEDLFPDGLLKDREKVL